MCSTVGQSKADESSEVQCEYPKIPKKDGSSFISKQELLSVLAKFFNSKVDFVVDSYEFKPVATPKVFSERDEFFVLQVTVTSSQTPKKDYSFFVKRLPEEAVNCHQRAVNARAFYKETELYSTLILDFEEAQEGSHSPRTWCPRCYFSSPGQLLILEHLPSSGFFQVGRREYLSKDQILAVMKSLAAFHTASIKFEVKMKAGKLKPRAGRESTSGVAGAYAHLDFETDAVRLKCHPGNLLDSRIRTQIEFVDLLPGYSQAEVQEIKRQLPDLLRRATDLADSFAKYRKVFIHGDLSTNNIFFRNNDQGDLDAVLVDYQMVRYAPPALDLILLLYLNQSRAFRLKEMKTLIQTYYNMFSEELGKSDICIQDVLPIEDFLDSCDHFHQWATVTSVLYFQTYLLPTEMVQKYISDPDRCADGTTLDRIEMISEAYATDGLYHIRMTEAMNDLIKTYVKL